jgi:quinolinate synthase
MTLTEEIRSLQKRRNAIILAHNYQPADVQDLADFTGDSLELARKAAAIEAEVIVFCGVHFMAETAAILNPSKTVLIPAADAGCPWPTCSRATSCAPSKPSTPQRKCSAT